MPLSSKERGACFRAKLRADPAAREENLAKRRERVYDVRVYDASNVRMCQFSQYRQYLIYRPELKSASQCFWKVALYTVGPKSI